MDERMVEERKSWRRGALLLLALAVAATTAAREAVPRAPNFSAAAAEKAASAAGPTEAARPAQQGPDCAVCHGDVADLWEKSPHVAIDRQAKEKGDASGSGSCRACHGDGENHPGDDTAIFSFESEGTAESNERCLSCHRAAHGGYESSPHGRAGLACTSCHEIHPQEKKAGHVEAGGGLLRGVLADGVSATCAKCHQAVVADFEQVNHHPLEQGAVGCTSCHDPHEEGQIGFAAGSWDSVCADCHRQKVGPFVFEHGASRAEGCTSCHQPHGSNNRHLLQVQNNAELCYSCHAVVPGFHTRFNLETQCTNCHVTIHGSNLHPAFLR